MSSTPQLPYDHREKPILDNLLRLRDELILLKQDKTTYVKSSDVHPLYERLIEQVTLLAGIRHDKPHEQNRGRIIGLFGGPGANESQVDRVLDACFQLISLFFMTIGKTNEAPAAYALTSTIKRLLDHLTEVDIYSAKDLGHIAHTLQRLRAVVDNSTEDHSEKLVALVSNRLEVCHASLKNLETRLDNLHGKLSDIYEKIISILRTMALANTRSKVRC